MQRFCKTLRVHPVWQAPDLPVSRHRHRPQQGGGVVLSVLLSLRSKQGLLVAGMRGKNTGVCGWVGVGVC